MKKRLVIVGATGSAYKRTIPALKNSQVCEVSAIQGRNLQKLKTVAEKHLIPRRYKDAQMMLADADYDLLYIATPPFLHLKDIRLALTTSKPIICEKPLCRTYKEAKEIRTLFAKTSVPFMLAHHLRHQQAVLDIRKAISTNRIGKVVSAWCQWGYRLNPASPNATWKLQTDSGGSGPFADAGIHVIDLALFLFSRPKAVLAHSFSLEFAGHDDNATALLMYDGMTVVLNASQTMPEADNHLLIHGTDGRIECPGAFGESSIRRVVFSSGKSETTVDYDPVNLYGLEVENFIASVFSGQAMIGTTLDEAMDGMRILDAINESSAQGRPIHPFA